MTQSPSLPKPDVGPTDDEFGYTADQMNAHGLARYEAGRAADAQATWQPIGWQFRFVFPTHAGNWKTVMELPMPEMGAGDGYHYETRLVYAAAPTQGADGAAPQAVVGEVVPDELYLMLRDISNEYHCSVGGDEVGKWLEKSWSRLRSLGLRAIAPSDEGKLLRMVFDDMDTCCGELGADYEFKELSSETVEAFKAYRANGGE